MRDRIRVGDNPELEPFPVAQIQNLITRYKDHENFLSMKDTMSENIKPIRFME